MTRLEVDSESEQSVSVARIESKGSIITSANILTQITQPASPSIITLSVFSVLFQLHEPKTGPLNTYTE